jgi:predicted esterase
MTAGILASCQGPQKHPAPPSDLSSNVGLYLHTNDSQEANRLLAELQKSPLSPLVKALGMDRPYPDAAKGLMPGRTIKVNGEERRYGLYVPESYQPTKAYSLILCLHGAGFDGDSYLERWKPRLGERYLLACPSIEAGAWWTREGEDLVLAVLGEVMRDYHVDPDRVFLTGMSNGAIGTYLIGLNHPDRFAALIPMAGALPGSLLALLDNARTTPLYLIHGAHDQVIPVRFSQAVEAYLKKRGYRVVYREHDQMHPMAGGHFFPRDELPALVDWLEKQVRTAAPREVTVVRDRDHPGRAYWIRIDEIAPEAGSLWASETDPEEERRLAQGLYARIEAKIESDNRIEVTAHNVRRYSVLLNPQLVDLDRPVRIVTNGELSFDGTVTPDVGVLLETARERPDPGSLVLAAVEVSVKP